MPTGAKEQQKYWERVQDRRDKEKLAALPTLMVAKVTLIVPAEGPAPDTGIPASLAPIKVLRGPSQTRAEDVNMYTWCEDLPLRVRNGVYLLAMSGKGIGMAVPLIEGQELAGVRAFFARIGEPNPWE